MSKKQICIIPSTKITCGNLIQKEISNIDCEKFKDAIVRITFEGNKNELNDFAIRLDDLKSQISKSINPIHVYHVQKLADEEQEQNASKIEQEILEKGHLDAADVENVVCEMIKEREQDLEEQKQLLILDKTIRDEQN